MSKILRANRPLDDYMLLCANCHIHQDLKDGTNTRGGAIKWLLEQESLQGALDD